VSTSDPDVSFDAVQDVIDQAQSEDVDLSENVAEDIVTLSRGNVVGNEPQFLLSTLQYGTGFLYDNEHFGNSVLIGPSSGGKTQVQKNAGKVIPPELTFSSTAFSGNALIDSAEWDKSLIAILDEYDKLQGEVQEQLKSMAGEDEGYSKERNVEDSDAEGGYSPTTVSSEAMPFQVLFAPTGAKTGIVEELDNRLLKLYVDDGKIIRELIGRKEAGHEQISHPSLEHTYIFDTSGLAARLRDHVRELPVVEVTNDEGELTNRRGGSFTVMPNWVWYAVNPIFDKTKVYTNRVYGFVFNMIRSSAVWNHHSRATTTIQVNAEHVGSRQDAYIVEPQDVANVLSCLEVLLSTTHKLTPRDRNILTAVENTQGIGENNGATLDAIIRWLERNDKPYPADSTMRSVLRDLEDQYMIHVREGAGPSGAHLYEWRSSGSIQMPNVTDLQEQADRNDLELGEYGHDVSDPFADAVDPIRDQPFKDTVEDLRVELTDASTSETSTDAGAFMGNSDTEGGDGDSDTQSQATLGGSSVDDGSDGPTPTREPSTAVETALHTAMNEQAVDANTDGEYLVEQAGNVRSWVEDTGLLDPTHEVWSSPMFDEGTVVDEGDAARILEDTVEDLREANLLVVEDEGVAPGFVRIVVQSTR